MLIISALLALVLDDYLGEPRHCHPLIELGKYIVKIEGWVYPAQGDRQRRRGVLAVALVIVPWFVIALVLEHSTEEMPWLHAAVGGIGLYLAIGWRSLLEHARRVAGPLQADELDEARHHLSMIVSRDTDELTPVQMAAATTESVLENGNDAIFAAIFWFALGGLPGVVLYRIANTLDAMWGYKNQRYCRFGWAAARLDDVLNWAPARLTAFGYACAGALQGNFTQALRCWRTQGGDWKSPNAGPVMAAGAGALGITLGGAMRYHGKLQFRPELGAGALPDATSIAAACRLVNRTLLLWLSGLSVVAFFQWIG